MRPLQMTTRQGIIAIAVVAALLAAEDTRQQWIYLRRRALSHAHAEASWRLSLATCVRDVEKKERLGSALSIQPGSLMLALEPVHRLVDEKSSYDAYWEVMNLPIARRRLDNARDNVVYHAAMRRKYEFASRRPWLSVAPDPISP
jgi:hypothetical protein